MLPELDPEPVEGDLAIAVLAPFIPGDDHDPRRTVGQTDCALGGILVLPSLPAGPEGVHPALGQEAGVIHGDAGSTHGGDGWDGRESWGGGAS